MFGVMVISGFIWVQFVLIGGVLCRFAQIAGTMKQLRSDLNARDNYLLKIRGWYMTSYHADLPDWQTPDFTVYKLGAILPSLRDAPNLGVNIWTLVGASSLWWAIAIIGALYTSRRAMVWFLDLRTCLLLLFLGVLACAITGLLILRLQVLVPS